MKVTIDTDTNKIVKVASGERVAIALYCKQPIELLSRIWLKVDQDKKYSYAGGIEWQRAPH